MPCCDKVNNQIVILFLFPRWCKRHSLKFQWNFIGKNQIQIFLKWERKSTNFILFVNGQPHTHTHARTLIKLACFVQPNDSIMLVFSMKSVANLNFFHKNCHSVWDPRSTTEQNTGIEISRWTLFAKSPENCYVLFIQNCYVFDSRVVPAHQATVFRLRFGDTIFVTPWTCIF